MRQKMLEFLLLALIAITCALPALAQEAAGVMWTNGIKLNPFYVPEPETRKTVSERWDEIGRDLETETNLLAGTFAKVGYEGGYMLRWSTKKGFILIPYWDQSLISDYSYGRVEVTPDSEIRLIPERELTGKGQGFKKTPLLWIPAVNGDYLVPKEELKRFSDYYGGYGEFNGFPRKTTCDGCGTFAKRRGDSPVAKPSFIAPSKYAAAIRKPIEGRISYIGTPRIERSNRYTNLVGGGVDVASVTPVLINAGSRKGVSKGTMFLIDDGMPSNFYQVLRIIRVGARSSEGVVIRTTDKNGTEMYPGDEDFSEYFIPLKKGTKLTTSALRR